MSTLQLEIVTPDRTVVSTETDMAVCPGVMGEFGVLPHHVSLLSALKIGPLRYSDNGRDQYVFISGGFADVNANVLTVLAESAERAEDIDAAEPPHAWNPAGPVPQWPAPLPPASPRRRPLRSGQGGGAPVPPE